MINFYHSFVKGLARNNAKVLPKKKKNNAKVAIGMHLKTTSFVPLLPPVVLYEEQQWGLKLWGMHYSALAFVVGAVNFWGSNADGKKSNSDDYRFCNFWMKIVTYNVNGLRPRIQQYGSLPKLLDSLDADIICFQETKLSKHDLRADLVRAEGYESFFSCTRTSDRGRSAGYSGNF